MPEVVFFNSRDEEDAPKLFGPLMVSMLEGNTVPMPTLPFLSTVMALDRSIGWLALPLPMTNSGSVGSHVVLL